MIDKRPFITVYSLVNRYKPFNAILIVMRINYLKILFNKILKS